MSVYFADGTHDSSVDAINPGFKAAQILYKNDGSADHTLTIDGSDFTIKAGEALQLPCSVQSFSCNGASGDYRVMAASFPTPALELGKPANGYAILEDDSLAGDKVADVADDNATSGVPVVHVIAVAGGADANEDITVADKCEVISASVRYDAAGGTASTLQLFNGADAITDQLDTSGVSDTDYGMFGQLDDDHTVIAAGGTLRATIASGASDAPAAKVFVTCIKRA